MLRNFLNIQEKDNEKGKIHGAFEFKKRENIFFYIKFVLTEIRIKNKKEESFKSQ